MKRTQHPSIRAVCRLLVSGILSFIFLLLTAMLAAPSAHAQTFNVLYNFTSIRHGAQPAQTLTKGAFPIIYGNTANGGDHNFGTIFRFNLQLGTYNKLSSFSGSNGDGEVPYSPLVRDFAGNLYGTTAEGGDPTCSNFPQGCGIVFKLDAAGNKTILHAFKGPDGEWPNHLTLDSAGNLYGTAEMGGDLTCGNGLGCGTVFKIDTAGTFTLLYVFARGAAAGSGPNGVIRDPAGNLYGTTRSGGSGFSGTVYGLDPVGRVQVLHSFSGGADGGFSLAPLILNVAGDLCGTTATGGNLSCQGGGCGTVFKLSRTGGFTVLHTFVGGPDDGAMPQKELVADGAGNLYGTTFSGGDLSCNFYGCGTVFHVDPAGTFTLLHAFAGADGIEPAGLIRDSSGVLYGATEFGGTNNTGVLFSLVP